MCLGKFLVFKKECSLVFGVTLSSCSIKFPVIFLLHFRKKFWKLIALEEEFFLQKRKFLINFRVEARQCIPVCVYVY